MTDLAPGSIPSPLADTGAAQQMLRTLERELHRGSIGGPPSDEALTRWQRQAESLRDAVQATTWSSRNRLLRGVTRFLDDLQDMRERKARYLARRLTDCGSMTFASGLAGWTGGPDNIPRQALAAGIHAGLRSLPSVDRSESPGGARAAAEHSDPPEPEMKAGPDTQEAEVALPSPEPRSVSEVGPRRDGPHVAKVASLAQPSMRTEPPALPRVARMSRRLDPIIAISGRLARPGSFDAARSIALDWLHRKGFQVPAEPSASFHDLRTTRGHTATAVSLPEKGVWALQAETADGAFKGRRWRVEMVLLDVAPTPAVSVTLTAISPGGSPEPPTSVPQLVTRLVDGIGLFDANDGVALDAGPRWIEDPDSLRHALVSIHSASRTRPVVVLSTYRKENQTKQLLDPQGLSRKLSGLAQVFVLTRDMAWPFNEAVGREAAVAGASVRMFRPGFDPDDPPGRHPFWSPTELSAQRLDLNGLSHALLREAAYLSLRGLEREDAIPAFDRVRDMVHRRQIEEARERARLASRQRTREGDSATLRMELEYEKELKELYEEENIKLEGKLARIKAEHAGLQDERDTLRGRVLHLEGRVQELLRQLSEIPSAGEPFFPDSWDDLEGWCEAHLGDRVVMTRKALRSAKNSRFLDVPFAYRVLWFLAESYVPARRNGGEEFKDELAALRLELSPVGRSATDRRSRETYSVDYKHERLTLDWHVKGSSDRDPRYGFRIYFHWHVRDECMVIGSMPEHLDNVLT